MEGSVLSQTHPSETVGSLAFTSIKSSLVKGSPEIGSVPFSSICISWIAPYWW